MTRAAARRTQNVPDDTSSTLRRRLFVDAADVSLQTVYHAFGSKYGLFSSVMDVVIAGYQQVAEWATCTLLSMLLTATDDPPHHGVASGRVRTKSSRE